jgi:hypothetical protein
MSLRKKKFERGYIIRRQVEGEILQFPRNYFIEELVYAEQLSKNYNTWLPCNGENLKQRVL